MGSLNTWGTVAAIVLLVECAVGMTFVLGVAFVLWRGSGWVVARTSQGLAWAGHQLQRGRERLVSYQARLVAPLIAAHGVVAGLHALVDYLRAGTSATPSSVPPPAGATDTRLDGGQDRSARA